ncbi:hypothetical protein EAT49_15790 [Histidinibacterium lentulum]|uniref:Uncharacterized protein n=1 Tax=Histidinibacterium lentulum TaxID=2480588 RepID=A0A3N2QV48_9RHOB|nr:hypothetical protein EAT49_15790 [Histidinibacterium lentulum]
MAVIESGQSDARYRFSNWFAGSLTELPVFIERAESEAFGDAAVRIVIVNASRAARLVRKRALRLGLPEAEE